MHFVAAAHVVRKEMTMDWDAAVKTVAMETTVVSEGRFYQMVCINFMIIVLVLPGPRRRIPGPHHQLSPSPPLLAQLPVQTHDLVQAHGFCTEFSSVFIHSIWRKNPNKC